MLFLLTGVVPKLYFATIKAIFRLVFITFKICFQLFLMTTKIFGVEVMTFTDDIIFFTHANHRSSAWMDPYSIPLELMILMHVRKMGKIAVVTLSVGNTKWKIREISYRMFSAYLFNLLCLITKYRVLVSPDHDTSAVFV